MGFSCLKASVFKFRSLLNYPKPYTLKKQPFSVSSDSGPKTCTRDLAIGLHTSGPGAPIMSTIPTNCKRRLRKKNRNTKNDHAMRDVLINCWFPLPSASERMPKT